MSKVIWKYPLDLEQLDAQSKLPLWLPKGAEILSVAVQMEVPCLWAIVDPAETQKELWGIYIHGTGHELNCDPDCPVLPRYRFLGTLMMLDGRFVIHIFAFRDYEGEERKS